MCEQGELQHFRVRNAIRVPVVALKAYLARPDDEGGDCVAAGPTIREQVSVHHTLTRLSSCAFSATMTVLADMSTAPIAGCSTNPHGARTPAASGRATTL
jgi:hypothetical protein